MARLPRLALIAALACVAVGPAPAAESISAYEHATHLAGNRWVLWSRHGDKRAALLETDTGTTRELPVDGWRWPVYFAPVVDGPRWWLYGIDNTGDEFIFGRTDLEGGGNPEIIRRFPARGPGGVGGWIAPGPGGTLLIPVHRDEGWFVDVFAPASGATERQLGPLEREPRHVAEWTDGRWLVIDGRGLWSWPDGEVLRYAVGGAPRFWTEPPPVLEHGAPEWTVPRPDGSLLLGSWQYLAELDGDRETLIARTHGGFRYPADGPTLTAALEYPDDLVLVEDRIYLWEKGGQRLLRLIRDGTGGGWTFQTTWARPVAPPATIPAGATPAELLAAALGKSPGQHWIVDYRFALDQLDALAAIPPDPAPLQAVTGRYASHFGATVLAAELLTRTGHEPRLWQPDPPPSTVDGVLAQFAAVPFVDLENTSMLSFLRHHEAELAVLEAHRDDVIPRLLEQRSASAAYTLALWGVQEADPWLRELAMDPTEHGWESGCTYPRATVGLDALQHLHQQPARELIELRPAERKRFRALAAANEQREGMDRHCGEGGHAAMMLYTLEGEED